MQALETIVNDYLDGKPDGTVTIWRQPDGSLAWEYGPHCVMLLRGWLFDEAAVHKQLDQEPGQKVIVWRKKGSTMYGQERQCVLSKLPAAVLDVYRSMSQSEQIEYLSERLDDIQARKKVN